jgi:putative nucleotidyltransferase with HDIG domain
LSDASAKATGNRPPVADAGTRFNPSNLYYALLTIVAAGLLAWQAPQFSGSVAVFALLVGLNIAAGLMPINIYGESVLSVGFVITVAIIIIFGPPGAIILGPLAALLPAIARQRLNRRTIPNAALFTVVNGAAAIAYHSVAPTDPSNLSIEVGIGVGLAVIVNFFVNAFLLSIPYMLSGNDSLVSMWRKSSWLLPHYLGMGVVGAALAAAYASLGIVGILAFVTPAFMMRLVMKQYVDKTEDNVQKLSEQNSALKAANIQIEEARDELRDSYDGTLEALVNALDARDQETKGHSIRVSHYMMDIAAELGVKEGTKEWVDMQRGSLLHDVGKIGVSDNILLKPGKLTDEEWTLMRQHPEIGFNMLRQVKFLSGAAEIVYSHHERWDGKGYPRGLSHEEVPLGARIFAVCDTFDSMTSDRPYRKALSTLEAMNEILKYNGSQFDPLVVEAFLDIYETWVKEREELHAPRLAA